MPGDGESSAFGEVGGLFKIRGEHTDGQFSVGQLSEIPSRTLAAPLHRHHNEDEYTYVADGTEIGFTKIGSGPVPLVMVHAAINSGEQWMPVAEALGEHCICYVMGRWGRGASEAHEDYSLERNGTEMWLCQPSCWQEP